MTQHELGDIGVVGVGHVGIHYVRHLIDGGAQVWVYDTDPRNLSSAVQAGAKAESSCKALAQQVDFILLAVPDPDADYRREHRRSADGNSHVSRG